MSDRAVSGIAPALVARFRADVVRLGGDAFGANAALALAVSGGPDSMALLALAAAAFPGRVIAATVDHRTRPATADEAALVARWCAAAGIAHAILPLAEPLHGSALHERARRARYAALAGWAVAAGPERKVAALATAHHADDQAETFLMRAVRGAGPAGLAGIRARRDLGDGAIVLLRPLLDWRRDELRAVAQAAAMPFVDDPSNTDDRFERSRVRAVLADVPWLDPAQLARAAAHVGEADDALAAMVGWLWRTRLLGAGEAADVRLDVADLPRELRRRLAREAIRAVRRSAGLAPAFDPATNIEALLDAVEAGRSATQAGVLASRVGTIWHFRAAPPRKPPRGSP